jgi:hypothetical protein
MEDILSWQQIRNLSSTHIVREPEWGPRFLEGSVDTEWKDTDALFGPGVLTLYPEIQSHPEAVMYGVGYGCLVACNGRGRQIAFWDGSSTGWAAP